MIHVVENAHEARAVIDRFNGFHDGFIQRLTLVSHDRFETRGVHHTTGPMHLEIIFAHYNYGAGEPPADRLIEARFAGLRNLEVHFTGQPTDWPITALHLERGDGPPAGGDPAGPLRARLIQPRLIENRRWDHVEAMRFAFERASFQELPGS